MKRTRIIATYGDIRGFGLWSSRAAVTPEIKAPFLRKFYAIMERFVRANPNLHFKYLGDGFLVIRVFDRKEWTSERILDHLLNLHELTRELLELVNGTDYLRKNSFRIRHAGGDSYFLKVTDPNDPRRKNTIFEFVEYVTNLAAHLLEVNPDVVALATENIIRALGKKKSAFRSRPLGKPSRYPKSVNREDADKLYILDY